MVKAKKIDGDIKAALLPQLFETYPDILDDEDTPSSWFCWSNEGQTFTHNLEACHASMVYDKGVDHLVTAIPNSKAHALAYQRMLITDTFRGFSDQISLEHVGEHYYSHITGLDNFPAPILFNYCIATRAPWEHRDLVEAWTAYRILGFDPTLSFLLSYSVGGDISAKTRSFPTLGHLWFDAGSDWSRILEGDCRSETGPFKTHYEDVCPTNEIWGQAKDYNKSLVTATKEEIAELFGFAVKQPEPPQPKRRRGTKLYEHAFQINMINNLGAAAPHPAPMPGVQAVPFPEWGEAQPVVEQAIDDDPDDFAAFLAEDEPDFD